MNNDITTPCIRVCRLNSRNECEGCGRLLEQIAQWRSYSEAERRRIMAQLIADRERPREP